MVHLHKQYTASIDIDCQKGFTPICPHELPVPEGHTIVKELNKQAMFAKKRICTKDWHLNNAVWIASEENPQLTKIKITEANKNVDLYWNAHCIGGTKGAELLEGLPHELEYDFVVYKGLEKNNHPYGAAYHDLTEKLSTGLIEYLRQNEIITVILGGLALDYCVFKTAKQLTNKGFNVIVNLAACRAIGNKKETSRELCLLGILTIESSKELKLWSKEI